MPQVKKLIYKDIFQSTSLSLTWSKTLECDQRIVIFQQNLIASGRLAIWVAREAARSWTKIHYILMTDLCHVFLLEYCNGGDGGYVFVFFGLITLVNVI